MRVGRAGRLLLAILLAAVPGVAGIAHLAREIGSARDAPLDLHLSLFVLAILFVPYALLSRPEIIDALRRTVDGRSITSCVLAAGLLCPYSLYWGVPGKATLDGLFRMVLYIGAASGLATFWPLGRRRLPGDLLVILAVWLPVELGWLDRSFPWPPGGSGRILCVLLALDLLLYLMLVVRRVDGAGYTLSPRRGDLMPALGAFVLFALVAIPLGLSLGFLRPGGGWPRPGASLERLVLTFLFTGVPEETLFRCFLQSRLERWTRRPLLSLCAASLIFGLAHLDNGPSPDWRYCALATLAGLAYGSVYRARRTVVAPALTHTLVDVTWKLAFG